MIEHRISRRPGRVGILVDRAGRTIRDHAPAPVVGASESLRIVLLDGDLKTYDPTGMADAAYLRFSICGDWDPATPPVYVTGAVTRVSVGTYEIDDPSGTYTAEAVALLGREAEKPCVYELAAYAEDPATGSVWSTPLSVVQYVAPLRNRADSLLDPVTLQPADLRGPAGPAATIAVGAVTTLPAGSSATVTNAGTESEAVLNFGIPEGPAGPATRLVSPNGDTVAEALDSGIVKLTRPDLSTLGAPTVVFHAGFHAKTASGEFNAEDDLELVFELDQYGQWYSGSWFVRELNGEMCLCFRGNAPRMTIHDWGSTAPTLEIDEESISSHQEMSGTATMTRAVEDSEETHLVEDSHFAELRTIAAGISSSGLEEPIASIVRALKTI